MDKNIFDDELTRQSRNSQIKSLQAAGRKPEDQSHQSGYQTGGRDAEEKGNIPACCQECGGICTDAKKCTVAQGNLSGVADENVEADYSDGAMPIELRIYKR